MANINDYGFPFTSVSGDRLYSSAEWREYFESIVVSGVVGAVGNELQVKPQATANKTVFVETGSILIKGALRSVTASITLAVDENTSGNSRIDRVVARLDLTNRKIEFAILKGTPASSPVAPSLTRSDTTYELSLAKITLANGYSTIVVGSITDERIDETVCGYFKYRAKPAWYPESGVVPYDAWAYLNFKNTLTSQEIADIEANSALMSIINGNTIPSFNINIAIGTISNGGTIPQTGGFSNYRYFVSPSSGLGEAPDGIYSYIRPQFSIQCTVNQITRVVIGTMTMTIYNSSSGNGSYTTPITANYMEIAWN